MSIREWFKKGRRGGTTVMATLGLTTTMTLVGVEVDVGRAFVAKQKNEVISDMITMAAAQKLPYTSQADTSAATIAALYNSAYDTSFTYNLSFYPSTGISTSVSTSLTEPVSTLFSGFVGTTSVTATGSAGAGRSVPVALFQGAVPIGVQYDQDFDLPTNGFASSSVVTLKVGKDDDDKKKRGNAYALDFGSGANDWGGYLKLGYTARMEVGDVIASKPGTMTGPCSQAISTDTDSRMNRALAYPFNNDTYSSFHPGNPRVVVCPLVDWKNASGGHANLEIKGFAAFWIDSYESGSGHLNGRFVRYTITSWGGSAWDGVSVDKNAVGSSYDGGFWVATQTN